MRGKITQIRIVGTADASGNISAKSDHVVRGSLKAIKVEYESGSATATNISITAGEQTILSKSANNTDFWLYPKQTATASDGSALTSTANIYTDYVIFDYITLTGDSQTAGKSVTVKVYVEEY